MNNEQHLLDEYIEAHTTNDDAVLAELYRTTHLHVMNPRMASGPVQGQFLQFIVQMLKPKRILEIGTFTGYSSICLAKALPEGGLLTTIEANVEYEEIIRKYFDKAQVTNKIDLIFGDAKQVIPNLPDGFDLVFIDADKISYIIIPIILAIILEDPGALMVVLEALHRLDLAVDLHHVVLELSAVACAPEDVVVAVACLKHARVDAVDAFNVLFKHCVWAFRFFGNSNANAETTSSLCGIREIEVVFAVLALHAVGSPHTVGCRVAPGNVLLVDDFTVVSPVGQVFR